jgi:hypothetical protein
LTQTGKEKLAELRREREDDEKVAALPKDREELRRLYSDGLTRLNSAVLAEDKAGVEAGRARARAAGARGQQRRHAPRSRRGR